MKYVMIFHANLNYAYLTPDKYEMVIRKSYEVIIDTFRDKFPNARYTFEASGYTIEQIAKLCPDVLQKLKDAIKSGQCEFMGSPYSHPMLANFPEEDGRWSNEFAMRVFEKHLGFRPESAWNPECSWTQYVPHTFKDVGYKYLTLDFESYMICNNAAYGAVERNPRRDMSYGGHLPQYDLDPDEPALHFPFKDVIPGLGGFCRSDRLAGKGIHYFLEKIQLEEYIENIKKWSGKKNEGALVIWADDAEYVGTTAWFFVKYENDYSQCFVPDEKAPAKLEKLIKAILEFGELATFKEACELPPLQEKFFVEDKFAWHRTYADVWQLTPQSKEFDPVIDENREALLALVPKATSPEAKKIVEEAWLHLTNSENSDGRWPPPPQKVCEFNYQWVWDEINETKRCITELKKLVG